MEWTESLRKAICYMEAHLLEDIRAEDVAEEVHISPFYLQKGFSIVTGYSIGEYLRSRRLYLAALDVAAGNEKIIDLAYKYGYETPESFTKAFTRFHGAAPVQIKKDTGKIRPFLPLKIRLEVKGGTDMDVTVEKKKGFQVIGFERIFSAEDSYQKIPEFWAEYSKKYGTLWEKGRQPENAVEETVVNCEVGEYGICIDDLGEQVSCGKFRYLIAGIYTGGEIPEGMKVYELPELEWACFRCVGAMPGALQSVNTRIFKEWLPGNPEYEVARYVNVEWYSKGDMSSNDYESAIWLPVKKVSR